MLDWYVIINIERVICEYSTIQQTDMYQISYSWKYIINIYEFIFISDRNMSTSYTRKSKCPGMDGSRNKKMELSFQQIVESFTENAKP